MCYVCYVGPDCASLYQCVIYEFLEMLPNIIIHRSRNRNKKLSKRKVKRNNFWEREGLDFPSVTVFIFSRIAQWCWSSLPTTIMIFPNLNISKKLLRTSDRFWGEKNHQFSLQTHPDDKSYEEGKLTTMWPGQHIFFGQANVDEDDSIW